MGTHPIFESDFDCLTDYVMRVDTPGDNLTDQIWYHGLLTREAADALLEIDGDFLVRCSTMNQSNDIVLSCKWDSQSLHFILLCGKDGKYQIDEESSQAFTTVTELIKDYQNNKHRISKLSAAILLRSISNFKKSSPKKPLRVPSVKNGTALDPKVIESIRHNLISMDSFKLARHLLAQEISVLKSHDVDILLPNARDAREKEIKRDLITTYFLQALLLIGESSQCCQLLDKLVSVCSELFQTLKCFSAFTTIMTCLTSHSVQNKSLLWESFRKNNMVTSLTFDRVLKPQFILYKGDEDAGVPYLASVFKMLDQESELNELEIPEVCKKLAIARRAVLNCDEIIKTAECRLNPRGGTFETQQTLLDVLSSKYQEKVLFGRAAVPITRFQNLDDIISNKCSF